MGRKIVVGDVHGAWFEVETLLRGIQWDPGNDILIFAGDYCDIRPLDFRARSRSVPRTIELFLSLRDLSREVHFVAGNHDIFMRTFLDGGTPPHWEINGGSVTINQYSPRGTLNVPESHQDFFRNIICQYYLDDELCVVHGGFPVQPVIHGIQILEQMVAGGELTPEQMTQITNNRIFIFSSEDESHQVWKRFMGDRFLITGHSKARGPYINRRNPRWLMVDGWRLHAAVIEDGRVGLYNADGVRLNLENGFVDE